MNTEISYIDVKGFQKAKAQPAGFIPLKSSAIWSVLHYNPERTAPIFWVPCDSGDAVRVPLVPYCSFGADPANAVAKAFEVGLSAGLNYAGSVQKLHLCIGTPVEELDNYLKVNGQTLSCFRFWLGVAVQS